MQWLAAHWGAILIATAVIISIANAVTRHYSEQAPGLARALSFLTEALSSDG